MTFRVAYIEMDNSIKINLQQKVICIFTSSICSSIETVQSIIGACVCHHNYFETTKTSSY